MKTLRQIHLYLGCVFAPLIIFFSLSGLWQTFRWHWGQNELLSLLSTLHTARGLKTGGDLSSPFMQYLVAAMALCLVLTVILGVVMAFRFGHKKSAGLCLGLGVGVPLLLIFLGGRF